MTGTNVVQLLVVLAAVLAGGPALAQEAPTQPRPPEKVSPPFVLPAGDSAIPGLVEQAARCMRCSILCPPPTSLLGQATVSVSAPIRVDAAACEETLIELLFTRRLLLVPLDLSLNLYEVVAIDGPDGRRAAAAVIWRTPEQILQWPKRKQMTVTVTVLQHIGAAVAVDALRPMIVREPGVPTLSVLPTPDGRGVLLCGLQDKVADAILSLRGTDKPGAPVAEAPKLADRLAALDQQMVELRTQVETVQKLVAGKR